MTVLFPLMMLFTCYLLIDWLYSIKIWKAEKRVYRALGFTSGVTAGCLIFYATCLLASNVTFGVVNLYRFLMST